jgi:short subunit dehydrogenase
VSRRELPANQWSADFLTGGGGIGAAIAHELATLGYTVGCASRGSVPFEAEHVVPIAVDLVDDAAVRRAFTSFAESFGVAGWANAAGARHSTPSIDLDLAALRGSLELNLISAITPCTAISRGRQRWFHREHRILLRGSRRAGKSRLFGVEGSAGLSDTNAGGRMGIPGYRRPEFSHRVTSKPNRIHRLSPTLRYVQVTRRIPVRRIVAAQEVGRWLPVC